jgi:putative DNA primase/helicase
MSTPAPNAALDFERLHQLFLGNCTSGMYEWLGHELGVSSAVLQRLQIGWVPIVKFKKGEKTSYEGWFTIPLRDHTGKVIGLSLRNRDGGKTSYPGGKAGLIYEVNPEHRHGEHGYSNGAHNWERIKEVGVECPVCHKPDGCLVSSDDPRDPKAVICIRVDSTKKQGLGWLHLLKPEAHISSAPVLAGTGPVIVVEGMSDTAAAMDLGFAAVGRPSNTIVTFLADAIRGRDAVVVGENDKQVKDDRELWPGHDGAVVAIGAVNSVAHSAVVIFPPSHVKDLRAWKNDFGLTTPILAEYIKENGVTEIGGVSPLTDPEKPWSASQQHIKEKFTHDDGRTLHCREEETYVYTGVAYELISPERIEKDIYEWLASKKRRAVKKGNECIEPVDPTEFMVRKHVHALKRAALSQSPPPCWIDAEPSDPDPATLIVSPSAIYVPTMDQLRPLTPRLFTTNAVDYAINRTAPPPVEWLNFLSTLWPDDPDSIALLQEWCGLCLTAETKYQKILLIVGQPRSGKGTIGRVLGRLIGLANVRGPTLASLGGQFGLQPLIDKRLAIIADARLSGRSDQSVITERLLSISGEDVLTVDRKNTDSWTGRLLIRLVVLTNEIPRLTDASGALANRFLPLQLQESYLGREDLYLEPRLLAELPSIFWWAVEGYRRLTQRGHFLLPQSGREAIDQLTDLASPIKAFIRDRCTVGPDKQVDRAFLYDAWREWSVSQGCDYPTTSAVFGRDLHTALPKLQKSQPRIGGRQALMYAGIGLLKQEVH